MSPAITHDRSIQKICQAIVRKGDTPGTNVFTISTGDPDRDGDRIDPQGWNLAPFKQNPLVLWGHDHKSLPVGRSPDIAVVKSKLKAPIEWVPAGIYPFADALHGLVDAGFVQSASVGFRVDASEPNAFGGHDIKAATLLEWSIVNIPSNPSAMLERGVDRLRLKSWLGNSWREQPREDDMPYLEIDDEPYLELKDEDLFDEMCRQMLTAYSEMDSEKFRELMARQIALLGPAASISDLVRSIMAQGVAAPKHWRGDDDLIDVDEKQLALAIGRVIADEIPKATRAALNTAMGRLD